MIRTFTELGRLGVEKGYEVLHLRPPHRGLGTLPVETFTQAEITAIKYASRSVFRDLDEHPEWDPEINPELGR